MPERSQKEYGDARPGRVIVLPQQFGGLNPASKEEKHYDLFNDGVL